MLNKIKQKYKSLLTSDDQNPNKRFKNKSLLLGLSAATVVLIVLLLLKMTLSHKAQIVQQKGEINWIKIHSPDFTQADNKSALEMQQETIDALTKQLHEQSTQLSTLTSNLDSFQSESKNDKAKLVDLIEKNKQEEVDNKKLNNASDLPSQPHGQQASGNVSGNTQAFGMPQGENQGEGGYQTPVIQTFTINYHVDGKDKPYVKTAKNYVPTGTFCRAVMLGGAEAQAGVDAQGDTSPILFKVLNNCYLPNGEHSILKGSLVTASVYGKISSERGMVRLDRLSYIRKDKSILDISVQGTAFDIGGKNGIRGIPILKNGKIIETAGLSGLLGGLGDAAKQYSTTQSVSPLGTTSSIDSSKILPFALGSGASTAFSKISDYYIKLAEQYQPIIELNAGAVVDLVFLKGFPIRDEKEIADYQSEVDSQRSQKSLPQQMMNVASNASLGAMSQAMDQIPQAAGQVKVQNIQNQLRG